MSTFDVDAENGVDLKAKLWSKIMGGPMMKDVRPVYSSIKSYFLNPQSSVHSPDSLQANHDSALNPHPQALRPPLAALLLPDSRLRHSPQPGLRLHRLHLQGAGRVPQRFRRPTRWLDSHCHGYVHFHDRHVVVAAEGGVLDDRGHDEDVELHVFAAAEGGGGVEVGVWGEFCGSSSLLFKAMRKADYHSYVPDCARWATAVFDQGHAQACKRWRGHRDV